MKKLIVVVVTLMLSGPVSGSGQSCEGLHDGWKSRKKPDQQCDRSCYWMSAFYTAYIAGWLGGTKITELMIGDSFPINIPNASTEQHLNVVGKWLENNPQEWHEDRDVCIAMALRDAYGMKE